MMAEEEGGRRRACGGPDAHFCHSTLPYMGCSHGSRGRTNQRLRTRSLSVPFALSLNPRRLPPIHSVSRASVLAYGGRMLAAVARVVLAAGLALCERVCACAARRGCDDVTARARTDGLFARARPAPCLLGSPAAGDVDRLRGRGCPPRARSRERPTRANGNAATCKGWVRCTGLEPTRRNGRSLSRSRRHRYISSHSPSFLSALLLHQPTPSAAFCSSHPPTISHGCPRHCPCTYSPTQISLRSLRPDSSPFSPPAWRPYRRQRPQALRLRKGAPGTPSSVPSPLPSLISLRHSSPFP